MKTLIVYYSLENHVKQLCEKLAERSGADLLQLHTVKPYPSTGAAKFLVGGKSALAGETPKLQPYIFNAEKYGAVIFASPVWASTFTPPIRSFVEENRDRLKGKTLGSLLSYKGGGGDKAQAKLREYLTGRKDGKLKAEALICEPNKKDPHTENAQKLDNLARLIKTW